MGRSMKPEVVTITPELAAKWLENIYPRDGVRGVRVERGTVLLPRVVDAFAEDIANDRWEENGISILLTDPEEAVIDGAHRLAAVVKANKPIRSLVVRLDPEKLKSPALDTSEGRVLGPCTSLTETQRRVMNAMRAGAYIWHPYNRKGRWAYVVPAAKDAKPYCIQYRTLDALLGYGLLEERDDAEGPDHHYRLKKKRRTV
jgi:hypothetical protein